LARCDYLDLRQSDAARAMPLSIKSTIAPAAQFFLWDATMFAFIFFLFLIFVFPFWMHSLRKKFNAAADQLEQQANEVTAYQSVTLEDGTKLLVPVTLTKSAIKHASLDPAVRNLQE
jgi:hypothetical protein